MCPPFLWFYGQTKRNTTSSSSFAERGVPLKKGHPQTPNWGFASRLCPWSHLSPSEHPAEAALARPATGDMSALSPGCAKDWPGFGKWVWLKIKQEGLRRLWSMFPLTRVPFWYRFFSPQPNVNPAESSLQVEWIGQISLNFGYLPLRWSCLKI